jgi:hypothetical protein
LIQAFLEKGKEKNSTLIHFCSVADEIVRDLKIGFFENLDFEFPMAIFCMAQPLA